MNRRKKKAPLTERRRTIPEKIFFAFGFTFLTIWSLIMIYIFVWAFASAFKSNLDYVREPLKFPELMNLHWENFVIAYKKLTYNGVGFLGMLWNSIWRVIGSTLISCFYICLVGYTYAQYDFKWKQLCLNLIVFIMIIPIFGNLPASYKLIYDLGFNDSPLYLLMSITGFTSNILVTYGFYKGLSRSYMEAVFIDGGSDWDAFFYIGLPMGKSIFTAYFLLSFINGWNDYTTGMLYFDKMPDLALGMYYFQQEIVYEANNPAYFAGALVVMLPVLITFILYSDKIMGKLYSGGLKG